ncbi:MAG TPA: nucleotidyltransferase family protein [Candidatus Paceibacterota bacterium]
MKAEEVVALYQALDAKGLPVIIDGGWAVDALLGTQTREHHDLDIAIERSQLGALKNYLESLGYRELSRSQEKMWDLVLCDTQGREIEVHAFSRDKNGNVIKEEYWDGYDTDSLSGIGHIANHEVRCASLSQLVKTHNNSKRRLKETDLSDMKLLSEKFGVVFE